MVVQNSEIIACARSWIGTRFKHQGRVKWKGVDCGGLILGVGEELGLLNAEIQGYPRFPDELWLRTVCNKHLKPLSILNVSPGDVALLRWGSAAAHLGILGEGENGMTLIHAHAQSRKVVEQRFNETWQVRLVAGYRYV